MAALSELIDDMRDYLVDPFDEAVTLRNKRKLINEAIQYYKANEFTFNTVESVVTLAAGDAKIPMPADMLILLADSGMSVVRDQRPFPMRPAQPFEVDWMQGGYSGFPYCYTKRPDGYYCWPTPDANYPMILRYIANVDEFNLDGSDDALSNFFTENAKSLITSRAASLGYARYRQDVENASVYNDLAGVEFDRLQLEKNNQNRTGRLSVDYGVFADVQCY